MFSVCPFTGRGFLTMDLWTGQGAPPPHWTWHWTSVPPTPDLDWTGGTLLDLTPDRGVPPPDLALDLAPDRGTPDLGLDMGTPSPSDLAPDRGHPLPPTRPGTRRGYLHENNMNGTAWAVHLWQSCWRSFFFNTYKVNPLYADHDYSHAIHFSRILHQSLT